MINSNTQKPVVLVFAGHDPSGGAGIQADIESIANAGCHAATVITSLTCQNTSQCNEIVPQVADSFDNQIKLIMEDMEIAACKIGMIGSIELIDFIHDALSRINVPVVFDPVISAASGMTFANENICQKMITSLLPLTTILTPNTIEARTLTQLDDLTASANKLLKYGTRSVLITGTHENTDEVINSFYIEPDSPIEYRWQRLPESYHGSGCTLSSRIAALLALGNDLKTAIEDAQEYTWLSLKNGLKLGNGQFQPDRFFK
jgi:hydroxymethylpyrimidine/phosphomethylpyrimidine kinase